MQASKRDGRTEETRGMIPSQFHHVQSRQLLLAASAAHYRQKEVLFNGKRYSRRTVRYPGSSGEDGRERLTQAYRTCSCKNQGSSIDEILRAFETLFYYANLIVQPILV